MKGLKAAMKAEFAMNVSSAYSTVAESAGLKPKGPEALKEIKLAFASRYPPSTEQVSESSLNSQKAAVGVESYVAKTGMSKLGPDGQGLNELDRGTHTPNSLPRGHAVGGTLEECVLPMATKAVLLGRPSIVNPIVQ